MAIGVSVVLVATGAALIWATGAEVGGVELDVVGLIVVAVGAAGALVSLLLWSSRGDTPRRRDERINVDR